MSNVGNMTPTNSVDGTLKPGRAGGGAAYPLKLNANTSTSPLFPVARSQYRMRISVIVNLCPRFGLLTR